MFDVPAEVAVRRIALTMVDRADAAWTDLLAASPEQRAPGGESSEALHDFRVSVRTLRSWLRAHRDLVAVPKKLSNALRASGSLTNAGRDAEVLVERLATLPGESRSARIAAAWWSAEAAQTAGDVDLHGALAHHVAPTLRKLRKLLQTVEMSRRVDEEWNLTNLADDLRMRIISNSGDLFELLGEVSGPTDIEPMHEARIAAKRLRYLVDPFVDHVGAIKAMLKEMKSLQEVLGDLHDIHVATDALHDAADRRATMEAPLRATATMAAGDGGRPRFTSLLPGFAVLSTSLRRQEDAAYARFARGWMGEGTSAVERAVDAVVADLGLRAAAGLEIERKYLLAEAPDFEMLAESGLVFSSARLEQGYLEGKAIKERVRRITAADGTITHRRTIKTGKGLVRQEAEEEITPTLFAALWKFTRGRRVAKVRHSIVVDDVTWEIDVFTDRSLVLAEVELTSVDQDVELPNWLDEVIEREVTDDDSYSNSSLSK